MVRNESRLSKIIGAAMREMRNEMQRQDTTPERRARLSARINKLAEIRKVQKSHG